MAPYFMKSSEIWCGSVCHDKRKIYVWLPTSFKVTKYKWLPIFGNVQYFFTGTLKLPKTFCKT